MTRPLLSIVIANYNYGRFLEDAIKSVIAQEVGDKVELIICDAASTDNSVEIIKKYADGLPPNTPYEEWLVQTNPELSTLNSLHGGAPKKMADSRPHSIRGFPMQGENG